MDQNDFEKVLNMLHAKKPLTLEQIKVLQAIIDSDTNEANPCEHKDRSRRRDGSVCNICGKAMFGEFAR